jgi:hypothetical protein
MKRLFLFSLIVALLVFSCDKEKKRAGGEVSERPDIGLDAADTDFIPVSTGSGGGKTGYILRLNASLMVLETDTDSESDKTKWAVTMALGDKVSVGEARRATWNGRVYDFWEIRREDGREGLAFASHIATDGRLAVVTDEKTNLYRSPKLVDVIGTILPRKSIVVVYPETRRDGFVEVKYYDHTAGVARQYFVLDSVISEREADIQSSILLQTAEPLKDEDKNEKIKKDALLTSALQKYPYSVFSGDITAMVTPTTPAPIATENFGSSGYASEDKVNVRELPDHINGKVVGQLNTGDDVYSDVVTVNTVTINGQSDQWYHITSPMVGWVFGHYLTFK